MLQHIIIIKMRRGFYEIGANFQKLSWKFLLSAIGQFPIRSVILRVIRHIQHNFDDKKPQ